MMLILSNYVIMPSVIDQSSYYLGFKLKSDRHFSNFIKHYVYLLLNTLLIPLFGLTSYETLFSYLASNDTMTITTRALHTVSFFIRFLVGITLFSNTV